MISRKKIRRKIKMQYYKTLCHLLNPSSRGLDPYEGEELKRKITRMLPGGEKYAAARLIVKGDVVGVGFVGWLTRKARVRNLDCTVKYRLDGGVDALIVGEPAGVEDVAQAAWKGNKKAQVKKVREYWYNKPVKSGSDSKSHKKKQVAWSQGTADRIKKTVDTVAPITITPNQFPGVNEQLVGTDELERAAGERNLFSLRSMKKELFLISPEKYVGIQRSQTTRVSTLVHSLTDHKQLTKDFLQQFSLPVPEGKVFEDFDSALSYLNEMSRPMVVKPAAGLNGTGVTVDVRTNSALKSAWEYAKRYHEEVVLEELVQGVDIRVVVIGGKARAALLRVPANVIGDGSSNIEKLLGKKNKLRLTNPRLCKNLIIPDAYADSYLERQGHTWDSIPAPDEMVFLHLKANICKGADSISITDLVHPDLMLLAEEAAAAFGINDYWGIDLLVEQIDLPRHEQDCAIIELNSTANIENVIYPLYGPSFDSARSLIDHIFPEKTGDEDYPIDRLQLKVSGFFDDILITEVVQKAGELFLTGSIQQINEGAEIFVKGRRKELFRFTEYLWDLNYIGVENAGYKRGSVIIDGLRVDIIREEKAKEIGLSDKKNFEKLPPEISAWNNKNSGAKASGKAPYLSLRESEVNAYDEIAPHDLSDNTLKTGLFLSEFQNLGFSAEWIYEDLIRIENDKKLGITGMKHSNLFSDRVCEKIFPAKKILALRGLPVRRGIRIRSKRPDQALDYFRKMSSPCVATMIHPLGLRSFLISSEDDVNLVWKKAKKKGTNFMLLEEYADNCNVCVAVVAGKAAAALALEPITLKGDGISSIIELLDEKNKQRHLNLYYRERPIELDKDLLERLSILGYNPDNVPGSGEILYLETKADFNIGGESIAITDILHKDFYRKAEEAAAVFPGLDFAYIYLSVPYPEQAENKQDWAVLKIETEPDPALFHYPWQGKAFNLTNQVIKDICLTEKTRWAIKEATK